LEEKLTKSEATLKDTHHKYLHALADMENVRRIAAMDVDKAKKFAVSDFAKVSSISLLDFPRGAVLASMSQFTFTDCFTSLICNTRFSFGSLFVAQQDVLEVGDNLVRALTSVPSPLNTETPIKPEEAAKYFKALYEGIQITDTIFQKVLGKKNVSRYRPNPGDKFDPNVHMATFKVPSADFSEGTIGLCVQDGYMIHDRVLRAAMVGVHEKPKSE
jgi:molecular chaperone GrpE (heat shock protein)